MSDNTTKPTLKPCPFCGGKNESFAGMFKEAFGTCGDKLIVCCDECDCMGSAGNSMEEAIEAWNTRAPIYIIDTGSTEQYGGKFTRPEPTDTQIEDLAALEHKQWAHWTKYMLNNMTPDNILRWHQQIKTPYHLLSDDEKESDRKWARIVVQALQTPEGDV